MISRKAPNREDIVTPYCNEGRQNAKKAHSYVGCAHLSALTGKYDVAFRIVRFVFCQLHHLPRAYGVI